MVNKQVARPLLFCLILLLMLLPVSQVNAVQIEIKKEASIRGDIVRLHDLAAISNPFSETELKKLESTIICAAPPPAETQIVHISDIASALYRAGIPLTDIEMSGARETLVKRDFELLAPEQFLEAFRAHVEHKTGWDRGSFSIQAPKNLSSLVVPVGVRELVVVTAPNESFSGSVSAEFDILINGELFRKVVHRFVVEQYVKALVTTAKLRRGEPAEQGNYKMSDIERSRLSGRPVTDIKQLEGKTALRAINPETPLCMEFFTEPPVFTRGETASLVWGGNGFNIVTKGRVLDAGRVNDIIRVRLPSKKVVRARVTDSGVLEVAY
ncbi:MAG: flagella basal body P-ring formation protein FlgA [Candidatus Abyssobacteria bacterium SURF_5]|uniref:Flagella basal body P-ring formation protein FlgA n=1 Tax=Abyssobacteria bacterium (strain SURF_5) TaxID=2093360 RepID=A0A3A4P5R0_ABYX5|nr:MAG: flagella basal body P-ring formation protein FlgA [Candidatus Abyssubacteria bacterium SURF_5]